MEHRFSPIKSKEELLEAIVYVHLRCFALCRKVFDRYLPVSGNIGIFCHYANEYDFLTGIRKELTEESNNWNGKYFRLHTPISVPTKDDVPRATYTYLYVRKPDFHTEVGDVDFVLGKQAFEELKRQVAEKATRNGVDLLYRPDLDMIRLSETGSDALPYITTKYMSENVEP